MPLRKSLQRDPGKTNESMHFENFLRQSIAIERSVMTELAGEEYGILRAPHHNVHTKIDMRATKMCEDSKVQTDTIAGRSADALEKTGD